MGGQAQGTGVGWGVGWGGLGRSLARSDFCTGGVRVGGAGLQGSGKPSHSERVSSARETVCSKHSRGLAE